MASTLLLTAFVCLSAQAPERRGTAPSAILVDDFEHAGPENARGQRSGAFADPGGLGYCYVFFTVAIDQVWGGKGHSLYVKFDTSKPGAWGGYWTSLGHLDLAGFEYLAFSVKGLQGAEHFTIGLKGKLDASSETKVAIEDALPGGVTTAWQRVRIPLRAFTAIRDWSDVNTLSFNFESSAGSRAGAIVIDEIAFEKQGAAR
jgi:hypothetical protein